MTEPKLSDRKNQKYQRLSKGRNANNFKVEAGITCSLLVVLVTGANCADDGSHTGTAACSATWTRQWKKKCINNKTNIWIHIIQIIKKTDPHPHPQPHPPQHLYPNAPKQWKNPTSETTGPLACGWWGHILWRPIKNHKKNWVATIPELFFQADLGKLQTSGQDW